MKLYSRNIPILSVLSTLLGVTDIAATIAAVAVIETEIATIETKLRQ